MGKKNYFGAFISNSCKIIRIIITNTKRYWKMFLWEF